MDLRKIVGSVFIYYVLINPLLLYYIGYKDVTVWRFLTWTVKPSLWQYFLFVIDSLVIYIPIYFLVPKLLPNKNFSVIEFVFFYLLLLVPFSPLRLIGKYLLAYSASKVFMKIKVERVVFLTFYIIIVGFDSKEMLLLPVVLYMLQTKPRSLFFKVIFILPVFIVVWMSVTLTRLDLTDNRLDIWELYDSYTKISNESPDAEFSRAVLRRTSSFIPYSWSLNNPDKINVNEIFSARIASYLPGENWYNPGAIVTYAVTHSTARANSSNTALGLCGTARQMGHLGVFMASFFLMVSFMLLKRFNLIYFQMGALLIVLRSLLRNFENYMDLGLDLLVTIFVLFITDKIIHEIFSSVHRKYI